MLLLFPVVEPTIWPNETCPKNDNSTANPGKQIYFQYLALDLPINLWNQHNLDKNLAFNKPTENSSTATTKATSLPTTSATQGTDAFS